MTFICYKEAHRQLQVYAGEIWPANDKTSFVPLTYPPTSAQRLDFIHVYSSDKNFSGEATMVKAVSSKREMDRQFLFYFLKQLFLCRQK